MTSTLKKFRVTFTTDIFLSTTRGLNLFTIRQRRNALLYTRRNQYHHCKGKKTIITTPVIATTWARKLSIIDSHHQQPLVFKSSLDSSLPRFLKNPFVGETLTVPSIQRTSQNLKKNIHRQDIKIKSPRNGKVGMHSFNPRILTVSSGTIRSGGPRMLRSPAPRGGRTCNHGEHTQKRPTLHSSVPFPVLLVPPNTFHFFRVTEKLYRLGRLFRIRIIANNIRDTRNDRQRRVRRRCRCGGSSAGCCSVSDRQL